MDWINANIGAVITVLTAVVTVASVIANFTPSESDNKVVEFVRKIVDWLALNWVKK